MSQLVKLTRFTKEELQTDAGVARLNDWMSNVVFQIQAMQGQSGAIKPDNNIDLQGKYKVINAAP